ARIGRRISLVRASGSPGYRDRLVEASELDERNSHGRKRHVKPGVDGAQTDGPFKTSKGFRGLPPKQVSMPSLAPCKGRIRVKSNRAVHHFGCSGKVLR